jgi:hypothetical protein
LPECGPGVKGKNGNTGRSSDKSPGLQPIVAVLCRSYDYVTRHKLAFLSMGAGLAVDLGGLGVAFFCDGCSDLVRIAAGITGIVIPVLVLGPLAILRLLDT